MSIKETEDGFGSGLKKLHRRLRTFNANNHALHKSNRTALNIEILKFSLWWTWSPLLSISLCLSLFVYLSFPFLYLFSLSLSFRTPVSLPPPNHFCLLSPFLSLPLPRLSIYIRVYLSISLSLSSFIIPVYLRVSFFCCYSNEGRVPVVSGSGNSGNIF